MESTYETVYTGYEVNIQYLESIFDKAGIDYIIKNDFESSLRAGYAGGIPGQSRIMVERSHFTEAQKIVEATFPTEKS